MTILYLNNSQERCGIYQIGKRIARILGNNADNKFIYAEVNDNNDIIKAIEESSPDVIIVNYFTSTMSWALGQLRRYSIPLYAMVHDNIQEFEYLAGTFKKLFIPDPTFRKEDYIVPIIRPIERFSCEKRDEKDELLVGSHGFGVSGWKRFTEIINCVSDIPNCKLRFNIGNAFFGDIDGHISKQKGDECMSLAESKGINLEITNIFFKEEHELVDWLSSNTVNMYFLEGSSNNGPAGSADLAISAQKAVVVNGTGMYRHLHPHLSFYPEKDIKTLISENREKTVELYNYWTPELFTSQVLEQL